VEAPGHAELGRDAGLLAGTRELRVKITDSLGPLLSAAKVVIDFTTPASTLKNLEACAGKGVAMVIGTTGLSEGERARAAELAKSTAVVMSPNMSVGVNLLFFLTRRAAEIPGPGFDIEVVEAHHRLKKDAPSGTALRLAEVAAAGRGWKTSEALRCRREGMIGERPQREIGVQALRAGDIVGDHTVLMAGPGERIELTHRAHSRDTFAQGAMRAAAWVAGRPPGLYDMQDVLGLAAR
jgi:4-hydroxy-tetrahydrodipicolinate reductase